ncbi:MAG TPA: UvrB/UvrC motif-containing protein [Arsenicitalea sp.]|jgi:hypothetical protein|nr:UvrB/UvrC motif-containing protein [Arsenicitalea sp.]
MSLAAVHRKIVMLEKQMAEAAEKLDFEAAARLRNEIGALRGENVAPEGNPAEDGGSDLVHQPPPGAMGLGTQMPVVTPPKGWRKPKKPDPMTARTKRGKPGRS